MISKDPLLTLLLMLVIIELIASGVFLLVLVLFRNRLLMLGCSCWKLLRKLCRSHYALLVTGLTSLTGMMLLVLAIIRPAIPRIHDEFSYLLASDTFASGRLANPSSLLWRFFETEHVLMIPAYISKYPPGQGLVLALGQVLGHPLIGVILSTMLLVPAAIWMARAWMPRHWAFICGLLVATHPGILAWWGNTYWGGSAAALGGMLLFGSVARLVKKPLCPRYSLIAGIGLVILANTRPFEGLVVSLPATLWLGWGCLVKPVLRAQSHGALTPGPCNGPGAESKTAPSRSRLVWDNLNKSAWLVGLPIMAVLLVAGLWMALYNFRTTGSPATFAYQAHGEQYSTAPTFIFESKHEPPQYNNRKLEDFYGHWERRKAKRYTKNQQILSRSFEKLIVYLGFYIFPAMAIPLVLMLIKKKFQLIKTIDWTLGLRDDAIGFSLATIGVVLLASGFVIWFHPHYIAPATGLFFLLIVSALRRTWVIGKNHGLGKALVFVVLGANLVTFITVPLTMSVAFADRKEMQWSLDREQIINRLNDEPGKHLVLERHGRRYTPHEEWIQNTANIDRQNIIWARELDARKAQQLINAYPDRKVWLLDNFRPPGRLGQRHFVPYPQTPAPLMQPMHKLSVQGSFVAGEVADLTGDDLPDLVLIRKRLPSLAILIATPDNTLIHKEIKTGILATHLVIADLDHNNKPDLLLVSPTQGTLSLIELDENLKAQTRRTWTIPGKPHRLVLGDIDGDNKQDIAIAFREQSVMVLLSTQSWAEPQPVGRLTGASTDLALADMNGDGRCELITLGNVIAIDSPRPLGSILGGAIVWKWKPQGWDSLYSINTLYESSRLIAGDINSDGRTDLVISGTREDTLNVWFNPPTEPTKLSYYSFADTEIVAVGVAPKGLALGDLNGDDLPDLIAACENPAAVSIVFNQPNLSDAGSLDLPVASTPYFVTTGNLMGLKQLIVGTEEGCFLLEIAPRP